MRVVVGILVVVVMVLGIALVRAKSDVEEQINIAQADAEQSAREDVARLRSDMEFQRLRDQLIQD